MTFLFVGGIERSGTTVFATQLARVTRGVAIPEAQFKKLLLGKDCISPREWRSLEKSFRFRLWNLPNITQSRRGKNGAQIFSEIVNALLSEHQLVNVRTVIDHTPENSGIASRLLDSYEDSIFAHVVRDPRAVIASLLRTDWNLSTIDKALEFWHYRNTLAEQAFRDEIYYPQRILTVRYEDFCANLVPAIEAVAKLLPPYEFDGPENGAVLLPRYTWTQHNRVTDPPSDNQQWRVQLSDEQIAKVNRVVAETFIGQLYGIRDTSKKSDIASSNFLSFDFHQWLRARARRRRKGVQRIDLPPPDDHPLQSEIK